MKRISVTVNLNRSTLQFDEAAYARLEQYLAESASLLEGDPDPQEILSDLEQAVADPSAAGSSSSCAPNWVSSGPATCRPELLAELADDLDVVIERMAPAPGASKKSSALLTNFPSAPSRPKVSGARQAQPPPRRC
jgi:hypothetical protein